MIAGELESAAKELAIAVKLDPGARWPNFYLGVCAYRLGRYEDAATAFSVCIGTAPRIAPCFYKRGLALAALGRHEQAQLDFDRALTIDPTLTRLTLTDDPPHADPQRANPAQRP